MLTIQTTEAKERLVELLRNVERGERVAITRQGQTIAHLVPVSEGEDSASYQCAVDDFFEAASKWESCSVSIEEVVRAKHEGRRY